MKALLVFLAIVVAASALTDSDLFAEFKLKYGKHYPSPSHQARRFRIFQQNLRSAEKLSSSNGATFGVTKFMDLTPAEFQKTYANLNRLAKQEFVNTIPAATKTNVQASAVDWRGKCVTPVKDQGQCGSCWAFSDAAAMEGCIMLHNGGTEVDVSAQQIVDCCFAGGSSGCNGGYPQLCLQWACGQDLATWDSYPYYAVQQTCEAATEIAVPAGTCTWVSIAQSETAIQAGVQNGVVSIALDATVLQYYTGGIISGSQCQGNWIDHAVTMVAWDLSTYTVKNSWGLNWGEAGFFRMQSGVDCLLVVNSMTSMAV
jgi:C1A family cysteine protease